MILAAILTALQWLEYDVAGFTLSDGVYGSCFYFSTGLHGMHVLVGTLLLAVALTRVRTFLFYHFTRSHHMGFEPAILYYHFVDVVWLCLFVLVYWWGSE